MRSIYMSVATALTLGLCAPSFAEGEDYLIVIKNHRFEPAQLRVPAGERVRLVIDNQDATSEEFESHDLRREKIIAGNSKASLWVGPLPKGEYRFFGEFHEATAKGKLIAE
jgi:plastocyanin